MARRDVKEFMSKSGRCRYGGEQDIRGGSC